MNEAIVIVERAVENDLDGIVALQDANQISRGGSLSARLPRERILAMMRSMPLIVARREGAVVGFLMTTAKAMNADIAIVNAMFTAYPGTSDATFMDRSASARTSAARDWRRRVQGVAEVRGRT